MPNNERTYIMIKPDGVQRGLIGEIIKRFEQKGYKVRQELGGVLCGHASVDMHLLDMHLWTCM